MDHKRLPALVGGILIVAVAGTSGWVAISGVVMLWLVHRKGNTVLSKAALFRSVASGGIAGGLFGSAVMMGFQAVIQGLVRGALKLDALPSRDEAFLTTSATWAALGNVAYAVVLSLVLAWGITLVADFMPRPMNESA